MRVLLNICCRNFFPKRKNGTIRNQWFSTKVTATTFHADESLVDARYQPLNFDSKSAVVYRDFVTAEEGEALSSMILTRMKRRRYEKGHWDAVITSYKEVELADEDTFDWSIQLLFQRVRAHLEVNHLSDEVTWLPCHAIDLKKTGELNAHVDSIKFSGDLVAGLSLLSPSIMRLIPDKDSSEVDPSSGWVDLYLPPLSLYALTGVSRYEYTHELLPTNSVFTSNKGDSITVERDHRLSVIFRDTKSDGQ